MKKKLVGVLAMVLAGLMAATTCLAAVAPPVYICTVNASGQAATGPVVNLTDNGGAFLNTWFFLNPATANSLLATGLTSISASLRVVAYLPAVTPGSTVGYMYTISDQFNP